MTGNGGTSIQVERLAGGPIVTAQMDARMGDNVNGPSLIRVPEWIREPLGRYYLYFAHHDGRYIRLAFADALTGPWRTWPRGVLPLAASRFKGHVASPDVHVDHSERRIRMYYHGGDRPTGEPGPQWSRVAVSGDGLHFAAREARLANAYLRVIAHDRGYLGMAMPGVLYRSRDPLGGFETGPTLFDADMRHCALMMRGDRLLVFYSDVGDTPERILLSEVRMGPDWRTWRAGEPRTVIAPEHDWEGAHLPVLPSRRGLATAPVHELRDPALFHEDGVDYLLYSIAGESGIAIARLTLC